MQLPTRSTVTYRHHLISHGRHRVHADAAGSDDALLALTATICQGFLSKYIDRVTEGGTEHTQLVHTRTVRCFA